MPERLVDVLNDRDTVLSVLPVVIDDQGGDPKDEECLQEALATAAELQLVPDTELEGLHARMHVCRGGQLTPVADVLTIRQEAKERAEQDS